MNDIKQHVSSTDGNCVLGVVEKQPKPKMLYIIRGLPGSGKTKFAKELARLLGIEYYEADMYFTEGDEYKFDPKLLPAAHAWCHEEVRKSLRWGSVAIVSNTFVKLWEIQQYIDLGHPFTVITMEGDYGNTHNVPPETLARMKANWEKYPAN